MKANNEKVFMTRRYPNLSRKVLERDANIAIKLINAWDFEKDSEKVLEIFLKEKKNLSDERYWELLRTVWIISGKLSNIDVFRELFSSTRKERYYFSTPEEAKKLRGMSNLLHVYRAINTLNGFVDNGISWTLSREYAESYKQMYCKNTIIERDIEKSKIFAFIDRNLESEIIIL
jgi:hypothetical protein